MAFQKGQKPPANSKPFQKGESPNPGGRPKKNVALDAWRMANAARLADLLEQQEIDDGLVRWWSRFKAGDPKALWLVPFLFGTPPKPAETQTVELKHGGPLPSHVADYVAGVAAIAGGPAEDS